MSIIKDIVFDLDDTLVKTNQHYHNVEQFFSGLFIDFKQIPKEEILECIKEEDMKLIKNHKYGYHWYRDGLVIVYERLREKYNIEIKDFEKLLNAKVNEEFTGTPELWDNAREILEHFFNNSFNLFIMTLGEYDVQMPKIEKTDLKKYFKRIFVVSKKDDNDYANLIKETNLIPANSYFVGNSIYSDIIPAKRAGFNCALFDKYTTFYNYKIEVPENVPIIDDLLKLKEIII